jgi:hypothetical protein
MAILEIIDNLDDIAEADRSNYTEVDGKFQREVEMPDVTKMKSALQKERDAREKYEKDLAKFKDVDPEKYAEMIKKQDEGLSDKERYENSIKKLEKQIDELKAGHDVEKKDLTSKLHRFHLDKEARSAALEAGVIPEDIDDVLLLTKKFRSLDDDGKIVILDVDGDPTGKTLVEFYNDYKEIKPKYYTGYAGGGGASSGNSPPNKNDLSKLSPIERLNAARRNKK